MKVSVLMPVYNAMPFLENCLLSIQNQSISDWELIAIDDHSSDQSSALLEQFQSKDERIKVYKNQAKGIIPALRMALHKSTGTYITRMDADDIMATHKLELLRAALLQHGKGKLSTAWVAYFTKHTLGEGYKKYAHWLNSLIDAQNHYKELYRECVIPSPCWMIHREDLINADAFEPNIYPEDYDLCFRFLEQNLGIIGLPNLLHYWRDHGGRTSRNSEVYANNTFLDLKVHYYLRMSYQMNRPLVVWGAGKKGKYIATLLQNAKVPFHWVCNSPNKIGKHIYGQILKPISFFKELEKPQFILAVANQEEQNQIAQQLHANNFESGKDYFFFC